MEWLAETGSKFLFQNTCEKSKSEFKNRNKTNTEKVPFFRDTLYQVRDGYADFDVDVDEGNQAYFVNTRLVG